MKRLLLTLMLLVIFIVPVGANDINILYHDTINAADTNAARADTVYTTIMDISGFNSWWTAITMKREGLNDTGWTSDVYKIGLQHSYDRSNWFGIASATGDTLQSIAKNTSGNDTTVIPTTIYSRDSTLNIGNYIRGFIVHRQTLSSEQPLLDNVYSKRIAIWISGIK